MRRSLLLVAAFAWLAGSAVAGPMDAKTIVVAGYAQQAVKPDFATVRIGVGSVEKTSSAALDANNALMRKVLDAIKAAGGDDVRIQTSDFAIRPQHPARKGEYGQDESVVTGYIVANTVTVTILDMKKIGTVIDAATRAGATMSGSVEFECQNRQEIEAKLLAEAVKDARRNAEIMAAAEGAKVGKLIAVSNTAPVEPRWDRKAPYPDRNQYAMETVVIVEGVVPVSAQVMAVFALE